MRSTFTLRLLLFSVLWFIAASAYAQQLIDPSFQINWPKVSGTTAPTATCTSANYGQPYWDLTTNVFYQCGTSGWYAATSTGCPTTGCTYTGPIVLSGLPTASAQAADKQYVDNSTLVSVANYASISAAIAAGNKN